MIVKLHGTSGSGKTTAVREFMDLAEGVVPIHVEPYKKPEAYKISVGLNYLPTYVLGSYGNKCGGVDTIASTNELIRLIWEYHKQGHLLFEGLLISTYHGAVGKFLDSLPQDKVWAFMDTPIDECVARVRQRRLDAGNTRPFNEANTRNRVKPIQALKDKLTARGETVVDIDGGQDLMNILYPGVAV